MQSSGYEPWGINLVHGKHESLVSLDTWQRVQDKREQLAKAPARKDINKDFPLRGFVSCGDCSKPYTASWSKGRNKRYAYYLCDTKGCVSYRKSVRKEKFEGEFETLLQAMQPTRELFELSAAIFKKLWNNREKQACDRQRRVQLDIRKLDKQLEQLLDRIVATHSTSVVTAYENRIAEI